jgi:hypothetical protein
MVAVLSLCGCGDKLEGKWEAVSIVQDGKETKLSDLGALAATVKVTMELDGGKATMEALGQKKEGTYKDNGDKVEVTIDNEKKDFVKDGDRLYMEESGNKLYFEK